MAILAYVAGTQTGSGPVSATVNPNFELVFTIYFFDDNDPANTGVGPSKQPGAILRTDTWAYPPTLAGQVLQDALRKVILDLGAKFVRSRAAQADANVWLPVGALVAIPGS